MVIELLIIEKIIIALPVLRAEIALTGWQQELVPINFSEKTQVPAISATY